jgi:hypothetical protein
MSEMLTVGPRAKPAASSGDTPTRPGQAPLDNAVIARTSLPGERINARNLGRVTPRDNRLGQRSGMTPDAA